MIWISSGGYEPLGFLPKGNKVVVVGVITSKFGRALIQWGEQDNVFPLELGERMARRIPNSQFLTYACCRHIPILEHPDRTAGDADAFMDSL